jgi:hypothetical protein
MNSKLYQERKNQFQVGDLVCYKNSGNRKLCGIITEVNKIPNSTEQGESVKIYWCIDKDDTDISPLSYPPIRKDGWIAAGLLRGIGNLKVVAKHKKRLTNDHKGGNMRI